MTPAIRIERVAKRFGGLDALGGVSLDIEQGEFFGLLGPNGAGKTTLISIIAGLTRPTSGVAHVMGHDVIKSNRQARRSLGVVPQDSCSIRSSRSARHCASSQAITEYGITRAGSKN